MSIAEAFESGSNKSKKGHFRNLVMIARSNGRIAKEEQAVLKKMARSLGLNDAQVQEILDHPERYPMHPPVNLEDRVERLIALVEMVQADGIIDQEELDVLYRCSAALGFPDERTAEVVDKVSNGLRDGRSKSDMLDELMA